MIYIRRITTDHFYPMMKLHNETCDFYHDTHKVTLAQHSAFFRHFMADSRQYGYAIYIDNMVVGFVRMNAKKISIAVQETARKRGIAFEALTMFLQSPEVKKETKVIAEIKPDNTASIRLFEKAGFVLVKTYKTKLVYEYV